jgi:hypothetical protein
LLGQRALQTAHQPTVSRLPRLVQIEYDYQFQEYAEDLPQTPRLLIHE